MTTDEQLQIVLRLAVGALGGLAVGVEREWSGRDQEEQKRFAGVRTFLLIGLLAALSSVFFELNLFVAGATVLGGSILLVVIAYSAGAFRGDRESTTEFAALIVIAAGTLAGTGNLALASAINVFVALVLVEKSRIHSFVYRIQSEDLTAGLRFAVLALVILPLLPEGPYGPDPGIRPRELWALVLLFSGLSFAGLIARRAMGPARGYTVAGLLGGIVSSTLVTLNFARESRTDDAQERPLAMGVIAACTVLPVRVAILTIILNPQIGFAILPHLAMALAAGLILLLLIHKKTTVDAKSVSPKNPLRLFTAIKTVLAFQIALFAFYWIRKKFGSTGVLVTSAVVGLTDVDTLLFMIGRQKNLEVWLAVQALVIGIISNTTLKLILALAIGKGTFRILASIGLILLNAVLFVSLFLF
ncbi:MgtC/SapB family protein [bacterium]|nr:MgtC/SapB family protein [bacterium]